MQKTYDCKLVTPMLLHGEDTSVAELRPPSIKGAMRFWWRAIHGNLSLENLKEEESKLFGGAGQDTAIKSSFRMKILSRKLGKPEKFNSLPHKSVPSYGYKEDNSFELSFMAREKELNQIEKIFELSTILGSFGQRSRRGFGSIQIIKDNKQDITVKYIEGLIKMINPKFTYTSKINYPYIKQIQIGKKYKDINDLLKIISKATSGKCGKHLFRDRKFSSPIYVSILKFNKDDYRPIITTLNCTSTNLKNKTQKEALDIMNKFKGAIL